MAEKLPFFAEQLRRIRERVGLSPSTLAQRAGLSKQGLSRLELGERQPFWDTVQRLALALRADFAEFADPAITLPPAVEPRPRGRPRKDVEAPTKGPSPKPKKLRGSKGKAHSK